MECYQHLAVLLCKSVFMLRLFKIPYYFKSSIVYICEFFLFQDGFGTSCSFNYYAEDLFTRMYVLTLFLGGFCMPLFIIIMCYTLIYRTVRQHEHMLRAQITDSQHFRVGNQKMKSEVKVAQVSGVVVALFCLAWVPYAIVALIGAAGRGELITPIASLIPAMFAKSAVVYNPLVYAVTMNRFKHRMQACFRCQCVQHRAQSYATVITENLRHTSSSTSSRETKSRHSLAKVTYIPKTRNGQSRFITERTDCLIIGETD